MKNVPLTPNRFKALLLQAIIILGLSSCKEAEVFRPLAYYDLIGSWTTNGFVFESGGPLPKADQLAWFTYMEASSFTFQSDSTYLKRSKDSFVNPTTVLVKLERGTFSVANGILKLSTRDTITGVTRNIYYRCDFTKKQIGHSEIRTVSMHATRDLLLKSLADQNQTTAMIQQNFPYLLDRNLFTVSQELTR